MNQPPLPLDVLSAKPQDLALAESGQEREPESAFQPKIRRGSSHLSNGSMGRNITREQA
jgi:hypothetical protein